MFPLVNRDGGRTGNAAFHTFHSFLHGPPNIFWNDEGCVHYNPIGATKRRLIRKFYTYNTGCRLEQKSKGNKLA